jgi:hypothetical protein
MAHTPGPWKLHERTRKAVVGASGYVVAACGGYANNKRDPESLEAELEANARLIAVAPDLLEALERALKTAEFEAHPFRPWHADARSAIAKARGLE